MVLCLVCKLKAECFGNDLIHFHQQNCGKHGKMFEIPLYFFYMAIAGLNCLQSYFRIALVGCA